MKRQFASLTKKLRHRQTLRSLSALALIGAVVLPINIAGADADDDKHLLKVRPEFTKPLKSKINPAYENHGRIIVKYREGTSVRLRDERFIDTGRTAAGAPDVINRLLQLDVPAVARQNKARVRKLFNRSDEELDAERAEAKRVHKKDFADLNLYYHVELDPNADVAESERLLDELNQSDAVEIAYVEPKPMPAMADVAPTTPDYTWTHQGYLGPAPTGIDAHFSWWEWGGSGEYVKFIDVEGGWRFTHEDLPVPFVTLGTQDPGWVEHGTSVLGEIVAGYNDYGVTGASPSVTYGTSSIFPNGTAAGINAAAANLSAGDVMLIEVHYGHTLPPTQSCDPACGNCGQFGYVPVEAYPAEFDAIKAAVAKGIVVVEAAGNGGVNLDDPFYANKFSRAVRDSGAVMVGASTSSGHSPMCWSNHGTRVDVHAWGQNVVTTGGGNLFNPGDPNQTYTSTFSGTSSASPIVTGAAINLQSVRKAYAGSPYHPAALRALLKIGATPQAASAKLIGPMPNLASSVPVAKSAASKFLYAEGPMPFRNLFNKCIDLQGSNTANGTKITLYTCNGTQAQDWDMHMNASDGTVSLTVMGKCMDVYGNGTANGTKIQAWSCTNGAAQKFRILGNGSIQHITSGRCVDVPSSSTTNSTQLQIWDCNGGNAQLFVVPGTFRKGAVKAASFTNKCVDNRGNLTTNGNAIQIYDCLGNANQTFQVLSNADATVSLRVAGKCADIQGAGTTNGTKIHLWDCHNNANQRWQMLPNGSLKNPSSGRCLDIPASNPANATQLQIWDCNGSVAQRWVLPN